MIFSVTFAISAILMHAYYSNSNANFSNYNSDKKNRKNCENQTFALVVIYRLFGLLKYKTHIKLVKFTK